MAGAQSLSIAKSIWMAFKFLLLLVQSVRLPILALFTLYILYVVLTYTTEIKINNKSHRVTPPCAMSFGLFFIVTHIFPRPYKFLLILL